MIKRNLKGAFLAFLLGILFVASATAAFAATAYSPYKYYGPYAGYSYMNRASVVSQSGTGVGAYTWVSNQDSSNVPTGYIAAWAGLYNTSGQIVASSGNWIYNDQPLNGMMISSEIYNSSGSYYSYGYTAAYDGNGYSDPITTYLSPTINY